MHPHATRIYWSQVVSLDYGATHEGFVMVTLTDTSTVRLTPSEVRTLREQGRIYWWAVSEHTTNLMRNGYDPRTNRVFMNHMRFVLTEDGELWDVILDRAVLEEP